MTERDNPGSRSGRQPAEGVRIIKAEEAQAALEAGEAAGRRPDDQLRFGDVPPAPQGPRPAHRFPLPDSVDPAEAVSLPPLAPRPAGPGRSRGGSHFAGVPAESPDGPSRAEEEFAFDTSDGEGPETAEVPDGDQPAVTDGPPTESVEIAPLGQSVGPVASSSPEDGPGPATVPAWSVEHPPPAGAEPRYGEQPGLDDLEPVESPVASDRSASGAPAHSEYDPRSGMADVPPSPPRYTPPPVESWAGAETATGGDDEVEADAPPWAIAGGSAPGSDSTTELAPNIPEEGITVSGGTADLPHWSDPPTGEVPRLRFDEDSDDSDEMEAWRALGARGVRWRDEHGWDEGDELADLVPEVDPVGALDQNRTEHSDLYSFDEDFERVTSRTGSNPVVDLTGEDAGDADDDWARIDTGPSRAPGRAGRAVRGGRRRDRGRGRRFVSTASSETGPGVEAASAGVDAPGVSSGAFEEVAGAAAGVAARSGSASVGGGATGGWSGYTDPTVASTTSEPGTTRRVSTSTATREAERPIRPDRPGGGPTRRPPTSSRGDDVGSRLLVGAGLVVLLIIAYAIGPKALLVLSTVIVVASAAEAYNMTRAPGFRPATLLGLVATVGCVLGAYWKGVGAIPVVTALLFAGTMLWYVLGVVEARPLANAAVTVMVFVWVSVLGSFSAVLLQTHDGKGLFFGAVIVAVAADVFAFGVGRWIGSRPMAPSISPHKTIEGFVGGLVGALIVGAIIGKTVHPWSGMRYGLILGLVIGLIAPAGDLFESMLKRDLGIKDSGSVLGGHGGLLDRFDGILLALPAAYFVATIAHIV